MPAWLLDLSLDGKLVFAVVNSGYVGEFSITGKQRPLLDEQGQPVLKIDTVTGEPYLDGRGKPVYVGLGEKITVEDTKLLVDLVEKRKIKNWLAHPIFGSGYLLPDPTELEEVHGFTDYRKRFNPLRYYSADEYIEFCKRDIMERTANLQDLFQGQEGAEELTEVINIWSECKIPSPK